MTLVDPADHSVTLHYVAGDIQQPRGFARQKGLMGLVVRTIGLARAGMKIGWADLAHNMNGAIWLTGSRTWTA